MFSYDMNSPLNFNVFNTDKSWDGTTLYAASTEPNLLKIKKLQLPAQSGVIAPPKLPPSAFLNASSADAWKPVPQSAVGPVGAPLAPSPVGSPLKTKLSHDALKEKKEDRDAAGKEVLDPELNKQNLYKTELCRNWKETGVCRYGTKCQFAHGGEELRGVIRHPKYKTEICRQFHTTGSCTYGKRCRFVHHVSEMLCPDGTQKDSEYAFQRQLAQLKFGNIMPSPNQSLFASPSVIPQEWFTEVEKLMGDFSISANEFTKITSGLEKRIDEDQVTSSPRQSQHSQETTSKDKLSVPELPPLEHESHESYDEENASTSCTETEEDSGDETSQEKRNKKKSRLSFFQMLHSKEKRTKSNKKSLK